MARRWRRQLRFFFKLEKPGLCLVAPTRRPPSLKISLWGAIELRKIFDDEWLLGLTGVLSIVFGAILIAKPGAGALALVWVIGWFAIMFGGLYIALAFELRKFKRT
jgi:Short repeat of unknown function (DUF308)